MPPVLHRKGVVDVITLTELLQFAMVVIALIELVVMLCNEHDDDK